MNCKNCQNELPDEESLCPFCGAEQEAPEEVVTEEIAAEEIVTEEAAVAETEEISVEETEEVSAEEELPAEELACEEAPVQEKKSKLNVWKLIAMIVGGIVLVGVLVWAVLYGLGIDMKPKANDIYKKSAYAVAEEEAAKKQDVVVATVGDKTLTNSELQLYYDDVVSSFYYQNYYYLSYMGLDLSEPLSEQECLMDEGKTWEQYFLENALTNWQAYTLVEIMAEQAGYEVDAQLRESIDNLPSTMESYALENGYESLEAYMAEDIGVNVNLDDYIHFYEVYYVCNEYLNDLYDDLYPTADEIEAYYAENAELLAQSGITEDMGLLSSVRHILVSVEGGTEDEDGTVTYSEEDWNTALAEAERILQEWKDGEATEDSFAQLATTYTDDTASASTGGLYTDISIDASYVEAFLNWSIDAARVSGDTDIVQTEYGYHIMYFVSGEDYCSFLTAEEIIAENLQLMMLTAREESPLEVDYKKICLASTDLM